MISFLIVIGLGVLLIVAGIVLMISAADVSTNLLIKADQEEEKRSNRLTGYASLCLLLGFMAIGLSLCQLFFKAVR